MLNSSTPPQVWQQKLAWLLSLQDAPYVDQAELRRAIEMVLYHLDRAMPVYVGYVVPAQKVEAAGC